MLFKTSIPEQSKYKFSGINIRWARQANAAGQQLMRVLVKPINNNTLYFILDYIFYNRIINMKTILFWYLK